MVNKLKTWICSILMPCTVGVFIGSAVERWMDYRNHPGLYEMNSAPWYTQILANAVLTALLLLLEAALYLLFRRVAKKREEPKK